MALNTSGRSSTRSERCALPGPHTNRARSDCPIGAPERGRGCSTATADNRSAERSKSTPTRMHECRRYDYATLVDASRLLEWSVYGADTTPPQDPTSRSVPLYYTFDAREIRRHIERALARLVEKRLVLAGEEAIDRPCPLERLAGEPAGGDPIRRPPPNPARALRTGASARADIPKDGHSQNQKSGQSRPVRHSAFASIRTT